MRRVASVGGDTYNGSLLAGRSVNQADGQINHLEWVVTKESATPNQTAFMKVSGNQLEDVMWRQLVGAFVASQVL